MNRTDTSAVAPETLTFDAACERALAYDVSAEPLQPTGHTRLFTHGRRTERVAVLLHGITNNPLQWEKFGQALYADGWNVFVPRLPYHGLQDLVTALPGKLTAKDMIRYTSDAVDIACGLGEKIAVIGLSAGGTYAAWAAQERAEVERAIVIAPMFGLGYLPVWLEPGFTAFFRRLPNQMWWWDPIQKLNHVPPHAYPKFSTHNLAETLYLGEMVTHKAQKAAPFCRNIAIISNAKDRSINNAATRIVALAWEAHGATIRQQVYNPPERLPHDLIDITQPTGKTDMVYAKLREYLEGP